MSMKQFPKLRPCLWDAAVALAVVALAVFCIAVVWQQGSETESLTVVVTVDGEEALRCPLEQFSGEQQYSGGNGYTLTVSRADSAGIQVAKSDCPTQDCVHTGTISRSGQSIVCLPARIIVALEGESGGADGPDVVIG